MISLFSRERAMELIRYFALFAANVKKIHWYQQYFATQEIIRPLSSQTKEAPTKVARFVKPREAAKPDHGYAGKVYLNGAVRMQFDSGGSHRSHETGSLNCCHLCAYLSPSGQSHQRAKADFAAAERQGGCYYQQIVP